MSEDRARLCALPSRYPRVFAAGPLPWGFEHGDGWCALLEDLCETINTLLLEEPDASVIALQIKEKFSALRFYCRYANMSQSLATRITTAIRSAEDASTKICEQCGKPAQRHAIQNVMAALCASCLAQRTLREDEPL